MKMSPRRKFFVVMTLLVVIAFVLGLLMLQQQSLVFAGALVLWTFVSSYVLYQVKCPNCATSLSYKGKYEGLSIFAAFANRRCRNCGYDLEK